MTTAGSMCKRKLWIAWNNGDERMRVQINEPAIARAFGQIKGVTRTAYSVIGPFTNIFLTPHTREWVQEWMDEHNKGTRREGARSDITVERN